MARHWTLSKQREPESHWHMRIAPTVTATVAPMLRINSSLASRPPTTAARVSSAPAATALHSNGDTRSMMGDLTGTLHQANEAADQNRSAHPRGGHSAALAGRVQRQTSRHCPGTATRRSDHGHTG